MKKLSICLAIALIGVLAVTTVLANCGSCPGDAKKGTASKCPIMTAVADLGLSKAQQSKVDKAYKKYQADIKKVLTAVQLKKFNAKMGAKKAGSAKKATAKKCG